MATQEEKASRFRLRSTYISIIVSISFVLVVLGLTGFVIIGADKATKASKENMIYTVFLKDGAKVSDVKKLKYQLTSNTNIFFDVTYISSEEAAENLSEILDPDEKFDNSILDNEKIIPSNIEFKVHEGYANTDSLSMIESTFFTNNKNVLDFSYQANLLEVINEKRDSAILIMAGISVGLLLISVVLINNSIRLAVYSKRFIIRSMQLLGATNGFIRKPFILTSFIQGLFASVIAIIIIIGSMKLLVDNMPELQIMYDQFLTLILFGVIVFVGMFITWISTYFAVTKYLRVNTDKLY